MMTLSEFYSLIRDFIIENRISIGNSDGFVDIISKGELLISLRPAKAREIGKMLITEADKAEHIQ